jgi:hypothetical protein
VHIISDISRHFLMGILSVLAIGVACSAEEDSAKAQDAAVTVKAATVKKEAKKTVRDVKDKTCEMVNGKMQCAGKKIKHKAQDAVDDIQSE